MLDFRETSRKERIVNKEDDVNEKIIINLKEQRNISLKKVDIHIEVID